MVSVFIPQPSWFMLFAIPLLTARHHDQNERYWATHCMSEQNRYTRFVQVTWTAVFWEIDHRWHPLWSIISVLIKQRYIAMSDQELICYATDHVLLPHSLSLCEKLIIQTPGILKLNHRDQNVKTNLSFFLRCHVYYGAPFVN